MFDLYTFATPNGRKASIALEELGAPYEAHTVDITKDEQFAPDFLAISPNNKIPALVDRERGVHLMESGAILVYLADRYEALWGDDRWQTLEWLMWQMGGLGPMLGQAHHFLKFNPGRSSYAERRYATEVRRLYGVLDRRLAERAYLSGSYSIADIAAWPWISRFEWQGIEDFSPWPHVRRWYEAIADRPAVQRGYDVPTYVTAIPRPLN